MAEKDRAALFDAIGGYSKCLELSTSFYARVARDPVLRPLFPGKSFRCAIEAFAAFLAQFLDGPSEHAEHRWWLSLRESHARFAIGPAHRDAWLANMTQALSEAGLAEPMREALRQLFEESSAGIVNTGPALDAPHGQADCPQSGELHVEMSRRWQEQRALDDAIQSVRLGELDRVRAAVASPPLQDRFARNRSVFAGFTAILAGSGHAAMVEYARAILAENPGLAHESFSGRCLLHAASAAGDLLLVEQLLRLGVDANILDSGGHAPLYSLGNECASGGPVVHALVRAGARVDACGGVKKCTALHMAARRDNVEAVRALLACGATIDARDSLGDTPLRRAVNCGQTGVAALLLAAGANPHSIGSKRLTPVSAARTEKMKALFQSRSRR